MGCRCILLALYFCSITLCLDFEGLRYPRSVLLKQQSSKRYSSSRGRRSIDTIYHPAEDHNPIYLNFDALKRTFNLRVWESWKHVFSDDFYVQSNTGCQTLSQLVGDGDKKKISFLRGHIAGKKDKSVVYGYAKDGVFHGRIKDHERGTSYYVEDPSRFKKLLNVSNSEEGHEDDLISSKGGVHSVIYEETSSPDESGQSAQESPDFHSGKGPRSHRKTSFSNINNITTACAYQGATKDFMEDIQAHITSYSADDFTDVNIKKELQQRVRRSSSGDESSGSGATGGGSTESDFSIYPKNTCLISIISDHMFTKQFQDPSVVSAEIANFVSELNNIFEDLVFSDGTKGYGFAIAKITIEDDSSLNRPDYKYKDPYIGVEKLLDLVSTEDHSQYCLAYLFTARDFMKGVLGLAWVAGDSAAGGICEAYKMHQNGERKSLNTGVITTINYGQQVAARVSHLTFTHEVGHNWGSPHDFPENCKPGGERGNYIMFASATSADKPNNNRFSTCSISNMSHVLMNRRDKCFKEAGRAVCGNMVLDEDEVCDCGFEANCLASNVGDQCCWPAGSEEGKGCTLRPGMACSPSQGPCCTKECVIVPASEKKVCLEASECVEESYCDGQNVRCEPSKKDNLTDCNRDSQVCINGVCVGSPCLKHNMEDCMCTEKNYLCDLCCRKPGKEETCQSSALLPEFNYNKKMRYIGSPCDAYNGYCDAFNRCMAIDSNGPLARLKDAIFNPDVYKDIFEWARGHWWLTVLICVTATIVFILFVKIFSVHTPSSNPSMPKNLHIRETVSTLPRTLRRTRSRASGSGGRPYTVSDGPPGPHSGGAVGISYPHDSRAPLRRQHSGDHPPPPSHARSNSRQRRSKPANSSRNNNGGGRNGRGRNNRGPPPPDSVPNNIYSPPPHHSGAGALHYPPSRQHSSSADQFELHAPPFEPPPYYA